MTIHYWKFFCIHICFNFQAGKLRFEVARSWSYVRTWKMGSTWFYLLTSLTSNFKVLKIHYLSFIWPRNIFYVRRQSIFCLNMLIYFVCDVVMKIFVIDCQWLLRLQTWTVKFLPFIYRLILMVLIILCPHFIIGV